MADVDVVRIHDESFTLLSDEPVECAERDRLKAQVSADALARLLIHSCASTPMAVAVDARRGMGKSTLMRLTRARLREGGVETVWYNAWSARSGDQLERLLKAVLAGFGRRALVRFLASADGRFSLVGVLRLGLATAAAFLGPAALVNVVWNALTVDPRRRVDTQESVQKLVSAWSVRRGKQGKKQLLVVFVDDLDRCTDQAVLALCEAVKLYLGVRGIAFVVSCDRAAAGPNGMLRDASPEAAEFMEKIFQTSYRLPAVEDEDVERYIRKSANDAGIGALLDRDLRKLVANGCHRNPRRIKRLINAFVLARGMNPVWGKYGPEIAFRVLLLQICYPEFYRQLVDQHHEGRRDAVSELRDYRRARHVLRPAGPEAASEEDWEWVASYFLEYEMKPPERSARGAWRQSLKELEGKLADEFGKLADDRDFISLYDGLMKFPDATKLIDSLRQLPLVDAVLPIAAQRLTEPAPTRVKEDFTGLHILWVDDHMANNRRLVDYLTLRGAVVVEAADQEEAELALANDRVNLVISDIGRSSGPEAGLDALQEWRDRGLYPEPEQVIFYASKCTLNRHARARELEALGPTSSPDLLTQWVLQVAQQQRAPAPASSVG
ncbi:P-loop NTPase fold protein [Streptomyces sp. NBC_00124]|uniref:P-loop NTPase fold protein n=1 Tax=Streptomyces sp. NBC_00124 TaxID=2975662 RepID=UPI00225048A9|nr:P-loop NTPase fold protein [Streptomyces sp. NBC_00124]MCX5361076.1 P-loop NTPase fold protein [Streptomyces sp. NBC_00124]